MSMFQFLFRVLDAHRLGRQGFARRTARTGLLLGALLMLISPVAETAMAQTQFTRPYLPSTASVEVVRPAFEDEALSAGTGALFVTGSYTLNENVEIVGELPVARAGGDGLQTMTVLGNPLLGFAFSSTRMPILVELGGRFPVAEDNLATRLGQSADYGRGSAFLEDERQLYVLGNTRYQFSQQLSIRVRGGLVYSVFENEVNGAQRTEKDLRLRYSAQAWREGDWLMIGLTFNGRGTTTAPGGYGGKSTHHVAATAILDIGQIAPGVTVGVPLDGSARDVAPFLLGLSIDVRLW